MDFSTLYDFAYIRKISCDFRTPIKRCVISSQAAFELAHTRTDPLVDRTISSMAATNVRVLPVPAGPKIRYGTEFFILQMCFTAIFCSLFNFDANFPQKWYSIEFSNSSGGSLHVSYCLLLIKRECNSNSSVNSNALR